MTTLVHAFWLVATQSLRMGFVILVLILGRATIRNRLPQPFFFGAWIVVAAALIVPIPITVHWLPLKADRSEVWVIWKHFGLSAKGALPQPPGIVSAGLGGTQVGAPLGRGSASTDGPTSTEAPWAVAEALAVAWALGAGASLAVPIIAHIRFVRRLRRKPLHSDSSLSSSAAAGAQAVDLRSPILVLITEAVGVPAMGGWLKPRIYFPTTQVAQLTPDELRWVAAHEFAHWRRGDLPAIALVRAAQALHWFNPIIWWAARCAEADCELACDEYVLRRLPSDEHCAYGSTLLRVATLTASPKLSPAVLGIFKNKNLIKRRIQMIAHYRPTTLRRTVAGFALVTAIAFACITAKSAERERGGSVAPQSQPPSASATAYGVLETYLGTWSTSATAAGFSSFGKEAILEMRVSALQNHQGQRFVGTVIAGDQRIPLEDGMLAWSPAKRKLVYFETLNEGQIMEGSAEIVQHEIAFDGTVTDNLGRSFKGRGLYKNKKPDSFDVQTSFQQEDGNWSKGPEIHFVRLSS